mmetsp:Transcript_27099/g.46065  ORF Transcript_27099/g.46065 Transcript_27099/m.46065 type:complete len:806 (-) Transcript_27099:63-2480(-)
MKFLASTASLLATTALSSSTTTDAAKAPHPLHPKFRSQLKCPYAENWLTKGAEAAANELGIDISSTHQQQQNNNRKLLGSDLPIAGSCTYNNSWTGDKSCMNFHGESWTLDAMVERCSSEQDGVASQGVGCEDTSDDVSGWCVKDVSTAATSMMSVPEMKEEASLMMVSAMASCDNNKMACEAFVQGTFVAIGSCASGAAGGGSSASDQADMTMEGNKCIIAPGAIGAAHQAGFSEGYSTSCPNTPAQDSPYMWPLKWAANFQTKNMGFGSDDIKFESRGRTFYALDKNWKRSDTTYQLGTLRTVGQGPCENIAGDSDTNGFGCVLNNTDGMSTMIHKGGTMYFIDWKEDTAPPVVGESDVSKIEGCSKINMAVVGNIRSDWYLDRRGDDTDVQYLGDQHVFYPDPDEGPIPMLAKQWRKKDFASQYFTMSMLGNPPNKVDKMADASVEDNMHWPMILNIPGEGFGDDMLQVYTNHELLTDEDDDLFMIVEKYIESGGECPERNSFINGDEEVVVGPPVQEVHIPSNLEVEEASWTTNEYTFSPVWQVPMKPVVTDMGAVASVSAAMSKPATEVSDRVTVESCYDEATKSIDMSFHFHDIDPTANGRLPWMAIGYRSSEVCAMTPPSGGVTPIVLVTHLEGEGEVPRAHSTSLLPTAKTLSSDAFASMYMLARDLGETDDHSDVSVIAPQVSNAAVSITRSSLTTDDTVTLNFKRAVGEKPEQLNLMYAIGMSSELGIHTTRKCFVINAFPACSSPDGEVSVVDSTKMEDAAIRATLGSSSSTVSMVSTFVTLAFSCMIGVAVWF